ncbi:MAG: FAD-dependent monooxygenase [Candidatus Eremiobacteraeota bacterium]|nr:FAD-dependent monooxygenase [Candidatus Eremiobacteraeota bacterium]
MVGAGPGGLMAALTAARAGLEVTCYEARADLRVSGCWLLGWQTQQLLADSGVGFRGRRCRRLRLCDQDLRPLYCLAYPEAEQASVVARQELLEAMRRACLEQGVRLETGVRLRHPPRADVVVGADGCDSIVRRWAGLACLTRRIGDFYRGQLSAGAGLDGPVEVWTRDGRRFGVDPAADGLGLYCTAPNTEPQDWDEYVDSWPCALARRLLGSVDRQAVQRCRCWDVWCHRWAKPPYFLVADAAHGQAPNLGQGANLAIGDGFVLADLLGRHGQLETVGREYQRRRKPLARRFHLLALALAWFSRQGSRPRDCLLRGLDRLDSVKPWVLAQVHFASPGEEGS